MKKLLPLGLVLATTLIGTRAHAASSTWLDTGSGAGWNSTTNWVGGVVPGNTTSGATAVADTATFNTAVGTVGTSGNPITIDTGRTIGGITFDTANVGAFTIGTTSNKLYLSSGQSGIDMTATAIPSNETINTQLVIGTGSSAATETFQNNSTNTGVLTIGGAVSGGTTGATTLTLQGTNTGANTISGAIGNGSSSSLSVAKGGVGTWVLTNASTYTGSTTVAGGTLVVTNTSGLGSTSSITLFQGALSLYNDGTGDNGTIIYGPSGGYNLDNSRTGTINVDHYSTGNTGNTIQLGSITNGSGLTVNGGDGYNLTFSGSGTFTSGAGFINNMSNGTLTLPSLVDSSASGGKGIVFGGLSVTGVTVVGGISPGTDSVALFLLSAGTLEMTGDSTYLGATTIDAGTLELNNSTGAALGSSALTFNGGTLSDIGASTSTPTSATTVTFSSGDNTISTASTTGHVLALGGLSRTVGQGAVNFTPYSTTAGNPGSITTSTGTNSAGILGGWATITTGTNTNWATVSGSTIVAFTGYTTLPTSGTGTTTNYQLANNSGTTTLAGNLNIGSLKITDTGTVDEISTGADGLTISQNSSGTGGLLVTGGGSFTITGSGAVGSGSSSGSEFIVDVTGGTTLTINNPINTTTAGGSGYLTKTGTGTLILTNNNSGYGSNTIIDGGDLQISSLAGTGTLSSIGSSGPITLDSGTLTYVGGTATTNRAVQIGTDGGEIDSSGTGALTFSTSSLTILSSHSGTELLTLGGTNTGANTISGIIGFNGSGNTLAVTKTGAGTWVLSATNTYTGPTTINAGQLDITGSTVAGSAFTVNSGGNLGGTGTVGGTVLINTGAGINLRDGAIGTLTTGNLTIDSGTGTALTFDITSGSSSNLDKIAAGTLTIGGSSTITINVDNEIGALTSGTTLTAGTYALLTYNGQLTTSQFDDFSLSNTSVDGDTLSLVNATGTLELVVTAPASVNYYFTGSTSGSFTDASNYYTAASGGSPQSTALSSTSNVYLNATSPAPQNTPDTLNTSASINSLNFLTGGTSLAGSGTLTLAATGTAGITDSATGGTTETVHPTVALGASQGWTVSTSSNTLAVTGGITGTSGQTLTLSGPGSYNFSGASSGAFSTTVSSGKLLLTNTSGSALGSGTLNVARGATIGGSGSATGLTAFNLGNTGSGTTQVQVGSGGNNTSTNLTLEATGASTIQNANLTFNINSATNVGSNAGNELVVGSTAITFGASTTLTLNLVGNNVIKANTAYVLIAGSDGGVDQYTGLDLSSTSTGNITTGLITPILNSGVGDSGNLTLALTGLADNYYGADSYLFLYQNSTSGADDIEVEVIPEPGTWALMLGGLAMLVFWQRRRKA
jgi:autotransporter-associated beta strand protein